MSQENVEIVKHNAEAWNRDDWDAWIWLIDPDLEWSTAIERVFEGSEHVWRGHSGAREAWEAYRGEAFEHLDVRLDEFRDLGTLFCSSGRSKPWGAPVSSK